MLPSFALIGPVVALGETAAIARIGTDGSTPPVHVTGAIAFGPVFGPRLTLEGGAAAVAYAAERDHFDTDFECHETKQSLEIPNADRTRSPFGSSASPVA